MIAHGVEQACPGSVSSLIVLYEQAVEMEEWQAGPCREILRGGGVANRSACLLSDPCP
jgi:hypothetical protein